MRFTGKPYPSPTTRLHPGDHCARRGSVSEWARVERLVGPLGRVLVVRYEGARRLDSTAVILSAADFINQYDLPERIRPT